jgi:hypothetical protein
MPRIDRHFCPTCGDTIYWYIEFDRDAVGIPIGNFEDPVSLQVYRMAGGCWRCFAEASVGLTIRSSSAAKAATPRRSYCDEPVKLEPAVVCWSDAAPVVLCGRNPKLNFDTKAKSDIAPGDG